MSLLNIRSAVFTVLIQVLISGCLSQSYSDLEALEVNCPDRDKCRGYKYDLTYIDRSCECDDNCTAYNDCCIDALSSRKFTPPVPPPPLRTDVTCLHYSEYEHAGVYVISQCSSSWNGPREVTEKCSGSNDFSDPLTAVPVTDVARKETYRNLACAECNDVDLEGLKSFRVKLKCHGVPDKEHESIISNLTYNQERQLWGVHRLNRFSNGTEFFGCSIIFDVPEYLNSSVRFCRSNVISTCATNWKRRSVAKMCEQYMTVVYSNTAAYRNPHCAICNHITVDELSCRDEKISRSGQPIFPLIFDWNQSDGGVLVGKKPVPTPTCPSNQIYDSFIKKCKRLACAIPGKKLVDGKCV